MEEIIRAVHEKGVPYLTIWGSSAGNLTKRPEEEVRALFSLYEKYFNQLADADETHKNNVRIRVLGRWPELTPPAVQQAIARAVENTAKYEKWHLTFLIGYDGKDEMLRAVESIVAAGADGVEQETIKKHLWTSELPTVDLVIRTGGEPHWSAGLMMWDVADAQLYFTETLWPDFTPKELQRALDRATHTEQRHGA